MLKRFFIISALLFCVFSAAKAQEYSFKGSFFMGGGLGLQFGSITVIDIAPHAGYYFTENLAVGVGLTYQFFNDSRYKPALSSNIYGGRIFGRYYIFSNIITHLEYEYLNVDSYLVDPYRFNAPERIGINNVYAGGGYRQVIGGRSGVSMLILWNLNETVYSFYPNPLIRIAADIGF